MANGKLVAIRMDPTLLEVLDNEVARLTSSTCGLGPVTRSDVLRIALTEFAYRSIDAPQMVRAPRSTSSAQWANEWIDLLLLDMADRRREAETEQ